MCICRALKFNLFPSLPALLSLLLLHIVSVHAYQCVFIHICRKIRIAMWNHQADFPLRFAAFVSAWVICDYRKQKE